MNFVKENKDWSNFGLDSDTHHTYILTLDPFGHKLSNIGDIYRQLDWAIGKAPSGYWDLIVLDIGDLVSREEVSAL